MAKSFNMGKKYTKKGNEMKTIETGLKMEHFAIFLIILLLIVTIYYWFLPEDKTRRLQGYFQLIAPLSIFIAIASFFFSQQSMRNQQTLQIFNQGSSLIQNDITGLYSKIMTDPDLINLWKGINSKNPALANIPNIDQTNQIKLKEIYIAARMFQIIENYVGFISLYNFDFSSETGKIWNQEFKNWFSYPFIKQQWLDYYQFQAGEPTKNFINTFILN